LQQHPLWSHLASLGAFTTPPPQPPSKADEGAGAGATKDAKAQANAQATPPFENRMAASYSGTLFVLAPHGQAPAARNSSASAEAAPRQSRLFFMDLPKLHASAAHAGSSSAPIFRELVCTTPLPAHSHTLQLNSQASYAAVHSTNTLYLVYLAANKLEKALMYAEPAAGSSAAATRPADLPGVKVKSSAVGAWYHQNNPSLQILQVSFHPLSDVHLLVLTNDSVLRIYNIKENLQLPCREIALDAVAQAPVAQPDMGRSNSRRNSGMGGWQDKSRPMLSGLSAAQGKPMVTGFCFGAVPASRASFSRGGSSASSGGSSGWDLFSLFFLFTTGSVSVLCPTVPPKVGVDRRVVSDLRRQEQARFDELQERLEQSAAEERERGLHVDHSTPSADEIEIEQVQARLLWLGETFGLHMDDEEPTTLQGQGLVVSRDSYSQAAMQSGMPQPWIQPAQPCGAQASPASAASSSSTLALPGFVPPAAGTSAAHPYPASHLFSFRHAWPVPPGRFFRAFVDGRLDLLLSVQGVQPLFATSSLHDLFSELDAAMAPSIARPTHALEQVCGLLAPGGRLEAYSINSLLLPVDVSRIDGVEVPHLAPQLASSSASFSRAGTMTGMLGSPGMSRPNSSMLSPQSSLARNGTYGHQGAAAGGLGSPLHPFNPQFRPLLDLNDGSGFFVVQPRGIRHVGYGDALDEVGDALARSSADDDALLSVRSLVEQIECEQRPTTATLMATTPRAVVGAVLIDDPLLGRYLLQLTAGGVSAFENVAAPGPHVTVIALPRSVHRVPGVKALLESSAAADAPTGSIPRLVAGSSEQKEADAALLDGEMARLSKYLSPFSAEIAPFLQRLRSYTPPAPLPAVAGGPGAVLNSPEAFAAFLATRKSFVSTNHDLIQLQALVRARVAMLGCFAEEQQHLFEQLEGDLVEARAAQAKINAQIDVHKELQKHLGDAARELQAHVAVQLSDLSPAERAWHAQLAALRSSVLPRYEHKLSELQRKQAHMAQVQRELAQASRASARKGLPPPEATSSHWSEQQLQAIKPVLQNQASAISALVQQMADLKKTMTTLRSHSALQKRNGTDGAAPPLLPGEERPRLLPPRDDEEERKSLNQPL